MKSATAKQAAPLPQPLPPASPATPQTAPQAQPVPSVAPTAKQAAAPAQPASPATPATQPTSAVREPEMNMLRGGSFMMGSNDDVTEKPTHQVTIKPLRSASIRFPFANGTNALQRWHARSWQPGARHERKLERCQAICCLARGRNTKGISAPQRSRMGICRPWRHANKVLVGRPVSIRHGRLQELL